MFITSQRLNPTGSLQQAREANVNASKSLESSKAVSGSEKTKQHTGFGMYGGLKNLTRIQAAVCPLLLCNFVIWISSTFASHQVRPHTAKKPTKERHVTSNYAPAHQTTPTHSDRRCAIHFTVLCSLEKSIMPR